MLTNNMRVLMVSRESSYFKFQILKFQIRRKNCLKTIRTQPIFLARVTEFVRGNFLFALFHSFVISKQAASLSRDPRCGFFERRRLISA